MEPHALDVAILGGGIAGGSLARQLSRQLPGLRVGLFERRQDPALKVGESFVEIASHYFTRRLGLTQYLYDHHLPKAGLRFFFDSEARDTPLEQMSEIGPYSLPFHAAFQVNRARLDHDLLEMSARAGVDVRTGVTVRELAMGTRGEPHAFSVVRRGGARQRVRCNWLIDASGRAGLVKRARGLTVKEEGLRVSAVWGRFENTVDIDDSGSEAFRRRVHFSTRRLSTVHFACEGYWIWFIPVKYGVMSVGVVGDTDTLERASLGQATFLQFLNAHRAVRELLVDAKLIDCLSLRHLAYGTQRFFHGADRWGCTGEAGSFVDPFYSPGSDFIAFENDFICDLIGRDVQGENRAALIRRASLYDEFMLFRTEAVMRLYRNLYSVLGSFELTRLKYEFDLACYYNNWVSSYFHGEHLDLQKLQTLLREKNLVLNALQNFSNLFQHVEVELKRTGRFSAKNLGEYTHGIENIRFIQDIVRPRPREVVIQTALDIFQSTRRQALELLGVPGASEPIAPARFFREGSLI